MIIKYRDDIGYLAENVDEYGISSDGQNLYFNDKQIDIIDLVEIIEGTLDNKPI